MRPRLVVAVAVLAAVTTLGACGPRQVEVRTAPQSTTASELAVHMTNNLTQAVNVYVVANGTDTFLAQVAANSTEHLPVRNVASGTPVTLKAVTVDGARTYSRSNVMLTGMYNWQVP